jgi:hypothetical protein
MRSNVVAFLLLSFQTISPLSAVDWRPVEPAELARKTPKVDPSADAEAIFWDVRIEDRFEGGTLSLAMAHQIRIKIFTERGKEQWATVEIPRFGKRSIIDVSARTIKAGGTVIDVRKDSIFDRELVKTKGLKVRGITFALPNVEVGDIIEYRYREVRDNEMASNMRLYFQRELPLWEVTYHLKPLDIPWLPYGMRLMWFQCQPAPPVREANGFVSFTFDKVPAFRPEPNMPPEDQLRAWGLVYYEEDKKIVAESYWKEVGKEDYAVFKPLVKADDLVKRTALELTSGRDNPDDQLAALDTFCRTKIKNLSNSSLDMTSSERKAVKENHSPSDTLKQKAGYRSDIYLLFAALAGASGFEARIARVPDRGDTFFNPQRPTKYFIDGLTVAIKRGDQWVFYDPATRYLDRGMLRWQEEGQYALLSDPKEGFFVKTQFSEPSRSTRKRRANLKLLEDGSLEGTVTYTYTGHVARAQKLQYEDLTAAQQEDDCKESLQARLSTAELSGFVSEAVADSSKPLMIRHAVSVPGYATRTAKRILFQPAFFQKNVGPRFTEAERKYDVYFNYAWAEDDEVTIELPEGWRLDQSVVAPANAQKFGEVGSYSFTVLKTPDERRIIYQRRFEFGKKSLVPAGSYQTLKSVFNFIQEQDSYTVSLTPQAGVNAK